MERGFFSRHMLTDMHHTYLLHSLLVLSHLNQFHSVLASSEPVGTPFPYYDDGIGVYFGLPLLALQPGGPAT